MPKSNNLDERMNRYTQEYRKLTEQLAHIGFIWQGSIQRRYLTCGKPNCVCHKDPQSRHGPYTYWTSKESQKTVSRLLDPVEANLIDEWIENRRLLDRIVSKMKILSRRTVNVALKLRKRASHASG